MPRHAIASKEEWDNKVLLMEIDHNLAYLVCDTYDGPGTVVYTRVDSSKCLLHYAGDHDYLEAVKVMVQVIIDKKKYLRHLPLKKT